MDAQTFLEQNEGPGLQHLALKTNDIFATLRALKSRSGPNGGFEFMKPASDAYYRSDCRGLQPMKGV